MVPKKGKSKRVSLKKKYKIEKNIRNHTRKVRKEAKNNPNGRKRLKKDPGIPNLWPFKEEMLAKMEQQKEKDKESKINRVQERKAKSIEELQSQAHEQEKNFELSQLKKNENLFNVKDSSQRAYYREFKKVVESSDVILEVLDARDPLGCRCKAIEEIIMNQDINKKIVLVLNKIDLVPKDNVVTWLKYLRNELPTIAFKCSTQTQKSKRGDADVLGSEVLLQLLKNYSRSLKVKTSITVGIIGYPNVGKSSLINSLKRTRSVGVGATPGFTKSLQRIQLDKNVKLIDSPGIVFSSGKDVDNDIILRNAVKIEQIEDAVSPVETIIERCSKEQLLEIYQIADFSNISEFLTSIAQKRGKLLKGGKIDLESAAKSILMDWNKGNIPFYTSPPKTQNVQLSSQILDSWSKQFNIDEIFANEQSCVIDTLQNEDTIAVPMESGGASVDEDSLFFLDDTKATKIGNKRKPNTQDGDDMHEDYGDDDNEDVMEDEDYDFDQDFYDSDDNLEVDSDDDIVIN